MELLHRTLGRARFAKSLGAMAAPAAAVNAAEVWRLQSWLESLPLTEIVGDALQQLVNELAEVTPHLGDSTPQREFALVRAVGATCDSTLVRTLLDEGGLLQRLADELVSGAGALERGIGGGGGELGGGGGGGKAPDEDGVGVAAEEKARRARDGARTARAAAEGQELERGRAREVGDREHAELLGSGLG